MLHRQSRLHGPDLGVRPARPEDLGRIDALREASIQALLLPELRPAQRAALIACTPLDTALVADGTYYLAEVGGALAACGGWSRRAALIRRRGEAPGAERMLDPATDAAAIRAMYTHPDFARLGLGSLVLGICETAARLAGFRRARLLATPPGRRLYLAHGWTERDQVLVGPDLVSGFEVSLMEKAI
jgi:GNAT superfamily N-acetyltransferase